MRVTRTVLSYDPVASNDSSRDSAATTTPSVWPSTTNRVEAAAEGSGVWVCYASASQGAKQ